VPLGPVFQAQCCHDPAEITRRTNRSNLARAEPQVSPITQPSAQCSATPNSLKAGRLNSEVYASRALAVGGCDVFLPLMQFIVNTRRGKAGHIDAR